MKLHVLLTTERTDAFEILDEAERRIFEITEIHLSKSYQGMDRAVSDALEYIEAIHSTSNIKFSVPTGFYELDEMLGGFQKSDLIILLHVLQWVKQLLL